MKKIFITRKIPDIAQSLLRNKGYEVDVGARDKALPREELFSRLKAKSYDAVLSQLTDKIDGEIMAAAPSVKIFANYAIGFDNLDIEEAKKRSIYLTNTPHGGADRVAEHTWALILSLCCRVVEGDAFVRAGKYDSWNPFLLPGIQVGGKVLGLVGVGRIGSEVARIGARGFKMKVAYHDIVRNEDVENKYGATYWPTIEDVLKQADIVSLHVPLMSSTRHLIDEKKIKLMKPSAILVNTARGPVVDESALVSALKSRTIAGAGLDVFEHEPKLTTGLADLTNVVLTPHIASSTPEAREDMARIAAENIIDALSGVKPRNLVYT